MKTKKINVLTIISIHTEKKNADRNLKIKYSTCLFLKNFPLNTRLAMGQYN